MKKFESLTRFVTHLIYNDNREVFEKIKIANYALARMIKNCGTATGKDMSGLYEQLKFEYMDYIQFTPEQVAFLIEMEIQRYDFIISGIMTEEAVR